MAGLSETRQSADPAAATPRRKSSPGRHPAAGDRHGNKSLQPAAQLREPRLTAGLRPHSFPRNGSRTGGGSRARGFRVCRRTRGRWNGSSGNHRPNRGCDQSRASEVAPSVCSAASGHSVFSLDILLVQRAIFGIRGILPASNGRLLPPTSRDTEDCHQSDASLKQFSTNCRSFNILGSRFGSSVGNTYSRGEKTMPPAFQGYSGFG